MNDINPHETLDVWQRIATWWDAQIGEGNDFQKQLIMPVTDRLLALRPGERVIDACCGNGNYSRRLAKGGAHVFAFDGAPSFIERARSRDTTGIKFAVIDAMSAEQLASLGEAQFDAAVCSMAVMDLPTIAPLLNAVRRALKPAVGRFVFSVPHPCFNSPHSRMTAELIETDGALKQSFEVRIVGYLDTLPTKSTGIINQPEPHAFFHRPISQLVRECATAGFTIDAIEEPAFPVGSSAKSAFSWAKRPQVPAAMVIRARAL